MNEKQNSEGREVIGAPVLRSDAVDKVRGEARFIDDFAFPGMLYGRVIRSSEPHARLAGLDLTEVENDPAVVCTVTADDVPGENVVHVIYDDQPALADGDVRYIGEPIALVAATSDLPRGKRLRGPGSITNPSRWFPIRSRLLTPIPPRLLCRRPLRKERTCSTTCASARATSRKALPWRM